MTAIKFYKLGKNETILGGRESLGLGESSYYGIDYKFVKIEKDEFINGVHLENNMYIIKTKSGKFIEIDKNNIDNYII